MRCGNKAKRKSAKKWIGTQFNKVSDDVRGEVVDGLLIPVKAKALGGECGDDTLNSSPSSGLKRYIEIPNGKYEDFRILFQRYLSLENLGYITNKAEEASLEVDQLDIDEMEGRVKAAKLLLFKGHETQQNLDDIIAERVIDIQVNPDVCHVTFTLFRSLSVLVIYGWDEINNRDPKWERLNNFQCVQPTRINWIFKITRVELFGDC